MDTTVADPLVGQVLDGRYRIVSRIARGGMATVYLGRDLKLGRDIAVKVMHSSMAQDEDFVRRFIGEAKLAAGLSHPNVVAVYDQGSSGQHVYLVMEYVPGRTLRDLLDERGRLGPRHALGIIKPVLAALGSAHRSGLIHRDVKPENVLLTENGDVKVADFGLARAETASKQTKTGLIIGTVGYMAPEQVLSGTSDARTDVYAGGIMLFELLTGRQPYNADSPLAVAYKHVNDTVPPPSAVLPGLPPQIDALIAAATANDPAHRPADAERLLAAVTDTERSLPPDIDQRLAHVTPVTPNATAVLPMQGTAPPRDPSMIPAHMLGARRGVDDGDTPFANRVLTAITGKGALIAVGLVALIVLGWAVWYQTAGQYGSVPSVVGLSVNDARAQLEGKGYKVATGPGQYSDKVAKGAVLSTDPAAGASVSSGAVVKLFPSLGQKPIPIPDVRGLSLSDAQNKLQAAGFQTTSSSEATDDVPRDQVSRTVPAAGTTATPGAGGTQVTIYVSTGPQVPNVVGQTQENAKTILEAKGFQVSIQEQDPVNGQPNDIVLSQNPAAGSSANPGDTITLIATKHDCSFNLGPVHLGCNNGQGGGNQNQVTVPSVIGQSFDQAEQTLRAAGFDVKRHDNATGHVVFQNPLPNSSAPAGTKVSLR